MMSRPGPPPRPPAASARLPEQITGIPLRPAGSLDRIEVFVHYTAWDLYRMDMADRWRRSHSADAPVLSSRFPVAIAFYVIVQFVYAVLFATVWRDLVPQAALWILFFWGVWWAVAPYLEARRQAEAAQGQPPVRFVFSPEGVEIMRLDFSLQIAWPGIRRVRETPFSFLIYPRQPSPFATGPDGRLIQVLPWMKLYFTLPLHCFADAADLRLFRTLICKHITGELKLRG